MIHHDPKPIILDPEKEKLLKILLWYNPNIDSFQSVENEIIDEKLYNDVLFEYLLSIMGMKEDKDVYILGRNDVVSEEDWEYYRDSICINCQKIIMSTYQNQTKTKNFLRVIRNSVAHGEFSFCEDMFIGFNTNKNNKKAVIKIKPTALLRALLSISTPQFKEYVVGYAFEKLGYQICRETLVMQEDNRRLYFDLTISKGENRYYIEIKDYKGSRYLHIEDLKQYLN